MSPLKNQKFNALRLRLRDGDPAAGNPELSPDESLRLRRRIMKAAAEPVPRPGFAPLLAVAASVLVISLGAYFWNESAGVTEKLPGEAARRQTNQQPDMPADPDRPTRTIHFVTSGGTRIIWTLNPDFDA
jgi:hypothetical protein